MCDGVLENYTGAMLRPYCDAAGHETEETGHHATWIATSCVEAVVALDRERLPGAHARDRRPRGPQRPRRVRGGPQRRTARGDSRHHIAHLQVIHPEDVPRFRELGVIANCQPYWAQHDPQMDELTIPFLGPERAPLQYPFASLHAAGRHPRVRLGLVRLDGEPPRGDGGRDPPRRPHRPGTPSPSSRTSASPSPSPSPPSRRVRPTSTATTTPARSRRGTAPTWSCSTATSSTPPRPPVADARVEHTIAAGRVVSALG